MYKRKIFKAILIIAVIMFCVSSLYPIQIEQITDISNEQLLFEYNYYSGAITGIDDRVFAQNDSALEEFIVLEDGSLSRISMFESKHAYFAQLYIYENKLYVFNLVYPPYSNEIYFRVFDISVQPMIEIPDIDLFIQCDGPPNFNFYDGWILVRDTRRTYKICSETMVVMDILPKIGDFFTPNFGSLFATVFYEEDSFLLRFYEMIDFQLVFRSELSFAHEPRIPSMYFSETTLIVTHHFGVYIIDVSDVYNPVILYDISSENTDILLSFSIYTGDYVISSDYLGGLNFFELYGDGNYSLISTKPFHNAVLGSGGNRNSLYQKDNFIIHQNIININVYDMDSSDFEKVFLYGNYNYFETYPVYAHKDNLFYLRLNTESYSYDIFSVLDNEFVARVENNDFVRQSIRQFQIDRDRLYVYTFSSGQGYFEIYQLVDTQATLQSRTATSFFTQFVVYEDTVFIDTQIGVDVYKIQDNTLEHSGYFSGNIQVQYGNQPENYIINSQNNNSIIFRDINDFNNILYQQTIEGETQNIWYLSDNYLFFQNLSTSFLRLMKYDIEIRYIFELRQYIGNNFRPFYGFNNVITENAHRRDYSEYFSIIEEVLTPIGSKSNKDRDIYLTYFYPQKKKMVEVAQNGIYVFDIEFDEYLSSEDIVINPLQNELLGNFPNPFNPETTISFTVGNAFIRSESVHVSIDIYNIRGQKVRSLLDGLFESGSHTVVWNGSDDNGRELGSGVYFYRMVAGDVVETKRMVLLK